jgi:hypothetical protein
MRFARGALLVVVGAALGLLPTVLRSGRAVAAEPEPEGVVRVEIEPRPPLAVPPGIAGPEEAFQEGARYDALAAHYRSFGGAGYKVGLVQRAERTADRYDALGTAMVTPVLVRVWSPEVESSLARAQRYERMGGSTWKVGLVQRELADARRYQPEEVLPTYTWPETVGHEYLPEKPVEESLHTPPSL